MEMNSFYGYFSDRVREKSDKIGALLSTDVVNTNMTNVFCVLHERRVRLENNPHLGHQCITS